MHRGVSYVTAYKRSVRDQASEHLTVKGSAELPQHAALSCPAHERPLRCKSLLLCWPPIASCISPATAAAASAQWLQGAVACQTQALHCVMYSPVQHDVQCEVCPGRSQIWQRRRAQGRPQQGRCYPGMAPAKHSTAVKTALHCSVYWTYAK